MSRVYIYALSEDNSKYASDTWKALLKKMLRLFSPYHREDMIEYGPVGEPKGLTSYYKSASPRDREKRVLLKRAIAARLLRNEYSFVIVHLDADKTWKQGEQHRCSLNESQFIKMLEEADWQQVVKPDQLSQLQQSIKQRLLILVPHYSIEAWLYQNFDVALTLCHRHYQGRDVGLFRSWSTAPCSLEELEKPKERTSLGSAHNQELASTNFPARRVVQLGQSFSTAVARLADCAPLVAALDSAK